MKSYYISLSFNEYKHAIQVDFVILCVGKYSDIPNMPKFEEGKGPEMFQGKVMHSMEYANMENDKARNLIKGKRVTLVGFKKAALDIPTECSRTNGKRKITGMFKLIFCIFLPLILIDIVEI